MKINYLKDLHIPEPYEWSAEAVGDWLHPLNGKLPDHLSLLKCGNFEFMSALWELSRSIIVMTERLDQEDPDPAEPLRNIDEVYTTRGWIIQTHRWSIFPGGITDGNSTITPDKFMHYSDWRRRIYKTIITETLELYRKWPNTV